MNSKKLVSIIIRTKNEERWISACLKSVCNQNYKNIEIIIVDNNSTDNTLIIANKFPVKILKINKFLPGKAINRGIRSSSGEYIVCLSGHCIPTNKYWLEKLIAKLVEPNIAGTYGRQEPLSYTNDLDKRDLLTVFGLDPKIQIKDPFFHNANSAIKRSFWDRIPFDEDVTNIEDRVWGAEVIKAGYNIAYEPEASVYHWHGINHGLNEVRAKKIVNILESMDNFTTQNNYLVDPSKLNTVAILPIKGEPIRINNKFLLEYTLETLKMSKYINEVYVVTDNVKTAEIAKGLGAKVPLLRPPELSEDYIGGLEVAKFMLNKIEDLGVNPDLVCFLSETYPFRSQSLIDEMIININKNGLDTLIAAKVETRSIWIDHENDTKLVNNGFIPRDMKDKNALVGLLGLCCLTHPVYLRGVDLLNSRYGFYEIKDVISSLQIRDADDVKFLEKILKSWWNSNYN